MLFNSFPFLLFFLGVTVAYYAIGHKWRWLLLLVASCYFYAFLIPGYLLVLFLIIGIDFAAGILIESNKGRARRFYLGLSIISNLGVLFLFKYHNFFVENLNLISGAVSSSPILFFNWKWALPIGLSFHTFQAMSYTIEVYRGNQKAERHIGIYALYVMFYPQLVAGPIERPQKLIPQLNEKHQVNYDGIIAGLKFMLWGFFMKVVVADRLGIYVDYVFRDVGSHSRLALITSTFFYSFQIYCDFAGYSLIALGSAKVMGFRLSDNFRRPYFAVSFRDFWQRWNITLSQWFRDYLYYPLGGSRVVVSKYIFNIGVVFILSGLWHGANWTFIIWGLLHGLFILLGHLRRSRFPKLIFNPFFEIISTFLLVSFAWIFFRSQNIREALIFIKRIFDPKTVQIIGGEFDERSLLVYSFVGICTVITADIIAEYFPGKFSLVHNRRSWIRMTSCIGLIIVIILFGVFDGSQFIYFQF
ncbi:MAG TPA: MBOAT family O-acyltransferase [Chitinophagaceae bacterium]|jgi:alginate O-acetyltransferase complex protein AlgI|nr:MBOAT family O-acyltransferase [Chitinophagaceae bacterium]